MAEPSKLPAGVAWAGWGSIVIGVLMDLSALMLVAAQAMLGDVDLDALRDAPELTDSAVTMLSHARGLAVSQALAGTFLVVVGIYFLKRRRWALLMVEVSSWLAIAYTLVSGPFFLRSTLGGEAGLPRPVALLVAGAGVVLIVLQVILLALFLRYLRRPEVRGLFDPGHRGRESA